MTTPPPSPDAAPLSRRTVIKHAGLAAAALAGLSACTNYRSGGATPSSAPATSAPATSAAGGPATATTAEIPVGGGKIFADIQAVITQPTAGQFKAFSSICTHQNCPVTDVTDTINCNCHGSRFSIVDGSVVNPPATQPLGERTVTVEGDNLTVA